MGRSCITLARHHLAHPHPNPTHIPDPNPKLVTSGTSACQYVGITSTNADGLQGGKPVGFGDGSLLDEEGATNLATMHYYQRMYGDAYVDLCERGLARMSAESGGGSLVGISSPGCTTQYNANLGYDMPGAGKCVMEYAMRLFALRCAGEPDS